MNPEVQCYPDSDTREREGGGSVELLLLIIWGDYFFEYRIR